MRSLILPAALLLAACAGCGSRIAEEFPLETRTVLLPNGTNIRAEVVMRPVDMSRGLMFRDSVPRGEGMLFIHDKPGPYTYFMYNVRIPLDMIFMSPDRRIVEIAANVPPCKTKASACPTYGGHFAAQYVLELGGGEAARYGLKTGDALTF
jgi:uncharacterized membrane protein (UPF0127 family)